MPRIFLSYRVADAAYAVDHLDERLRPHFEVFRDKRSLEPGDAWPDRLRAEVERCDVLLAVIGPDWLSARDADFARRIDKPDDWVRNEILTAIERNKRVIPVLVGGAAMPSAGALKDLQALAGFSRRRFGRPRRSRSSRATSELF